MITEQATLTVSGSTLTVELPALGVVDVIEIGAGDDDLPEWMRAPPSAETAALAERIAAAIGEGAGSSPLCSHYIVERGDVSLEVCADGTIWKMTNWEETDEAVKSGDLGSALSFDEAVALAKAANPWQPPTPGSNHPPAAQKPLVSKGPPPGAKAPSCGDCCHAAAYHDDTGRCCDAEACRCRGYQPMVAP